MLIESGVVNRVTIVAPTDHLKRQWADAAARVGIAIDPNFKNADGQHGRGFIGVAVTYAQVASKPMLHRAKTEAARTLVILDEIHHGGEALSWGDGAPRGVRPGRPPAVPDRHPVPLRHLAHPVRGIRRGRDGIRRSKADYTYGYGKALRGPRGPPGHVHGLLRPDALAHQRRRRNGRLARRAAVTKDITSQAWRTALEPGRRMDPGRAGRGGQAAERGPPQRPGRRRPGDRHRP